MRDVRLIFSSSFIKYNVFKISCIKDQIYMDYINENFALITWINRHCVMVHLNPYFYYYYLFSLIWFLIFFLFFFLYFLNNKEVYNVISLKSRRKGWKYNIKVYINGMFTLWYIYCVLMVLNLRSLDLSFF